MEAMPTARRSLRTRWIVCPTALFVLTLTLTSCRSLQETRYFRYTDHPVRATWVLYMTKLMGQGGAYVYVVETDARGKPMTGDTLRVWVQHYGENGTLYLPPQDPSMIICCYPELLPDDLRKRHVLPDAEGIIMCADYDDGELRVYAAH